MDPDDPLFGSPADDPERAAMRRNIIFPLLAIAYVIIYILLQKKLVPKAWWLPLTKFYFYPMMLPNYVWRTMVVGGTYFSKVDDVLLLGAVPLIFAGHIKELHTLGVHAVVVGRRPGSPSQRSHSLHGRRAATRHGRCARPHQQ